MACTPVEPAPDGPTSGELSVLTYNVQGLPDALSDSDRPTADRMQDISPFLNDYDLIGVQEDFDADWHGLLTGQAEHPTVEHMSDPLPDRVYSSGLSLLSRVGQVSDYTEHYFSDCHGTLDGAGDCLASKGFQILTLQLAEGVFLDVVNTHHEAGSGVDDETARQSQVREIIAAMQGRDHAAVLLGDMNLHTRDAPDVLLLQEYADAGFVDACESVGCEETFHIDRVFVRSGSIELSAVEWSREAHLVDSEGEDLSDHPAIASRIEWRRVQ